MEKKNTKGTTALVVLLLIVTIAALILATYAWAKYTSSGEGNATAEVAKWNVTFNNDNAVTIAEQHHVVTGKIAPGSSGSFNIVPVANDTEVCFDYEIRVTSFELVYASEQDATTVFDNGTADETLFKQHISLTYGSGNTALTPGTTVISGTYVLQNDNTANATTTGVTQIKWAWAYQDSDNNANETWDALDTKVGQAVAAGKVTGLKFNYTVKATQVNPANAAH